MINCENVEAISKKYRVKFKKFKVFTDTRLFQFGNEYFWLYEFVIEGNKYFLNFCIDDNDYYNLTNRLNFLKCEYGIESFEANIKFLVIQGKKGFPDCCAIETKNYNLYNLLPEYKFLEEVIDTIKIEVKEKG